MGLHFFAHEGEDHTQVAITATTIPWWKDELTLSVALVVGFVLLIGSMYYVFKAKFPLLIMVTMAYMLVVGVACYSIAPVLSIISLAGGMFLALATTMLTLAHKQPHKNSPGK